MALPGKEIEKCKDPLIGLQYIREFLEDKRSNFCCDLCQETCGSTLNDVILHATFRNHRSAYMKKYYKAYFDKIVSSPIHEHNKLYCDYSRIIESNEGRKKIQYLPKPPPIVENIDPDIKFLSLDDPKLSNVSNLGAIMHRVTMKMGFENIGELFAHLEGGFITNEEEAAKVFEVANLLTKTLLEYRLNNNP